MRTLPAAVLDTYPGARTVELSLTFESDHLEFSAHDLEDSLGLSDPATFVDICQVAGRFLRVCNLGDALYVQDGLENSWVEANLSLFPGSRPGVEIGPNGPRIWYQSSAGDLCYYDFSGGEVVTLVPLGTTAALAPVAEGCYVQSMDGNWLAISYVGNDGAVIPWQGRIYGDLQTPVFLDAVSISGVDYIFTMDRNAGRTLELTRRENQWSSARQVLPLDIVDNTSGFTLAYASVINGKPFVTGRLIRANDSVPVAMDIFTIGPDPYSFGRYQFITEEAIGGKLFLDGTMVYCVGVSKYFTSPSARAFGVVDTSRKNDAPISPVSVTLSDAETSGVTAAIGIPVGETIAKGDTAFLDAALDGHVVRLGTFQVRDVTDGEGPEGAQKSIACTGKALATLERWNPFQSFYMASQAAMSSHPGSLENVVRARGTYSQTNGPLTLNELNTPGLLYSVARPSANTLARGKFRYPPSPVFLPRFGVGVNYYQDSKFSASLALGKELADVAETEYGDNGLVAIYGSLEHLGSPGVSLYLLTDGFYKKLASAPLTIPVDEWHWLQVSFIDGLVTVSHRADGVPTWENVLSHTYNDQDRSPWVRDVFGRGLLYIENVTSFGKTYGFESTDDVIPLESLAQLSQAVNTGIGALLTVDEEKISCFGSSIDFVPVKRLRPAKEVYLKYVEGEFPGYPIPFFKQDDVNPDGTFVNASLYVTKGPGAGRAFRVTGYDADAPQKWVPTGTYANGDRWQDHVDDPNYGSWKNSSYRVIYVSADPAGVISPESVITLCPGVLITERDVAATEKKPATHAATTVSIQTDLRVECDLFETYSGEVDISIMDGLKRVFAMGGAQAPTFSATMENPTVSAAWMPSVWGTEARNFIADFAVPVIPAGGAVGMAFRLPEIVTSVLESPTGYMLLLTNSDVGNALELWIGSDGWTLTERFPLPFTAAGNMRISVQDGTFSSGSTASWRTPSRMGPTRPVKSLGRSPPTPPRSPCSSLNYWKGYPTYRWTQPPTAGRRFRPSSGSASSASRTPPLGQSTATAPGRIAGSPRTSWLTWPPPRPMWKSPAPGRRA